METMKAMDIDTIGPMPQRNLIWIPMDLYRKATESSTSDTSSQHASASWQSTRVPQSSYKNKSKSKKVKASLHLNHQYSQHNRHPLLAADLDSHAIASSLHRKSKSLRISRKSKQPRYMLSPLHSPSRELLQLKSTAVVAATSVPSSSTTAAAAAGTPPASPLSSRPRPEDLLAMGPSAPLSPIALTNLSLSLPCLPPKKKRKASQTANDQEDQPDQLQAVPVPNPKRLRIRINLSLTKTKEPSTVSTLSSVSSSASLSAVSFSPQSIPQEPCISTTTSSLAVSLSSVALPPLPALSSQPALTKAEPREIILISDDDEDEVQEKVDEQRKPSAKKTRKQMARKTADHASVNLMVVAKVVKKVRNPTLTVVVPEEDDEDSSDSSNSCSSSDDDDDGDQDDEDESKESAIEYKYDLSSDLRAIVDQIFPPNDMAYQEKLERAFATSRKLRDEYLVDRFLGSGSSGFVLSAKRLADGKQVAIKVIENIGDHVEHKVQRELDILTSIKEHENILEFVEYFTSSLYGDIDPDDQSNTDFYYIVTEHGGYSLFDFLEVHKPSTDTAKDAGSAETNHVPEAGPCGSTIPENVFRSIFTQLALGLYSMHSQNVVHGDIKDENALISVNSATNTYRAKLCDFGHSKILKPSALPPFAFYGTTILAPPEMDSNMAIRNRAKEDKNAINHIGRKRADRKRINDALAGATPVWDHFYGFEADVWAMGLMLYTMIHGDLPGELYETDPKLLAAYTKKRRSGRSFMFTIQNGVDPDLKDLLKRMLATDPTRRLTMSQVLTHKWFTNNGGEDK